MKPKSGTSPLVGPGARCTIQNCKNSALLKKQNGWHHMSFHKYPVNKETRKKWIEACRPYSMLNLDNRYICSDHFERSLFREKQRIGGKTLLVTGAVPTLKLDLPASQSPPASPSGSDQRYEQYIEKIVLSSDEDEGAEESEEVDVISTFSSKLGSESLPSHQANKPGTSESFRTDVSIEESMDSRFSDEDFDKDLDVDIPPEDFDLPYSENLIDSETSCKFFRNMTEKARRAAHASYLARLTRLLPPWPRVSRLSALQNSVKYLRQITAEAAAGAVEEEILLQRHYRLRRRKAYLESLALKAKANET